MLIILDDDPTGTQTTRGLPVLTAWSVDVLREEFSKTTEAFFILTNSRALQEDAAAALNRTIAGNLKIAAEGKNFCLVSRGDSTLRGHFPLETDVLREELGPFDVTFLIPYFEAGGRITKDDIHYVREGEVLIPVGETPFAKDPTFGFRSSNLRDYVEEKSNGKIKSSQVASISLELLGKSAEKIALFILSLEKGCHCIVNSASHEHLAAFVSGLKIAEDRGGKFLFRTAAEFVATYLGQGSMVLLEPAALKSSSENGGVIVVGSHVPKSSAQLAKLLESGIASAKINVTALLDSERRAMAISEAIVAIESRVSAGLDIVIFTSRERIDGKDGAASLDIAGKVSSALVEIVSRLSKRPRFLVAKGGITSSDLATEALGIRRAMVIGQVLPGVPVWEAGAESLFPSLPYIVFPGNVGTDEALVDLLNILTI